MYKIYISYYIEGIFSEEIKMCTLRGDDTTTQYFLYARSVLFRMNKQMISPSC